jgi:hypothetical protein
MRFGVAFDLLFRSLFRLCAVLGLALESLRWQSLNTPMDALRAAECKPKGGLFTVLGSEKNRQNDDTWAV